MTADSFAVKPELYSRAAAGPGLLSSDIENNKNDAEHTEDVAPVRRQSSVSDCR